MADYPPAKKLCSPDKRQATGESFTPREYQIEILESAKEHNTIACLGTGTGKTFIAVMLIREMAPLTQIPFNEGGKKIFFLVPTVPLVHQQAKVIEKHTELKVGRYFGEMNVDAWSKDDWAVQFAEKEVLVMTGEICRIILDHSFLSISRICLLIFDECHQARGKSPYSEVMKHISSDSNGVPRIFGLSASLLNGKCKVSRVQRRLQELEVTMKSTIVTASDYADVQKYGTDPDEVLVLYHEVDYCVQNIKLDYSAVLDTLVEIEVKMRTMKNEVLSENDDDDITFFKKPCSCINQLRDILIQLGPWCACCAAKVFCKEIDRLNRRFQEAKKLEILSWVKSKLHFCIQIFSDKNCNIDLMNIPHKLLKFLEICAAINNFEFSQSTPNSNDNFKCYVVDANYNKTPVCIIFVEQRIVAYVLCEFVREVSRTVPKFNFMKSDFIVGHGTMGSCSEVKESSMSVKKQEEIVRRFRNKEFNILITTSVLEEGMDIQKCNAVVRFDIPKDFRSYVQSKGRARAPGSKFIMLLSDADFDLFKEDICNFKTIERLLLKECHNREYPNEEMFKKCDDLLPPYQPVTGEGSPRITLTSAISLINRYCAKLPCDMTIKLTANWKIQVVDPDSVEKRFFCTLRLPINSPLRQPIVGEVMKRKKVAKMAAALKACEMLHKIGELDDNLLPYANSMEGVAKGLGADEEEKSEDGTQPGTNRRRQLYKKGVADVLSCGIPTVKKPCYLHIFVLNLVVPLAKSLNPRGRPIVNPAEEPRGFGLLTSNRLPKVPNYPVFTKVGKVQVGVICIEEAFYLSIKQISDLQCFHRFIFTETLWLVEDKMEFCPDFSDFPCLIVPINRSSHSEYYLDWEFVNYTLEHHYNQETSDMVERDQEFYSDLFTNAVVTRTYLKDRWHIEKPVFHYVNKIHYDLTPCDNFEGNKFNSFKEFYESKYSINLKFDDQPMLEVERCQTLNLIKPLYKTRSQAHEENVEQKSKSKQRHKNYREYLVPELCFIHPFPSTLFRKVTCLPSILYRLNYLLLAEQIRHSVAVAEGMVEVLHANFHWPVFNLEQSDKELRNDLVNKGEIIAEDYHSFVDSVDVLKSSDGEIISFEVKQDLSECLGPSPSCILQALTTKSAGDEFDLERLETIGDSFLKYVMSVMLFINYPSFDEGKLTKLRSKLIRNLNLYQLAKKKQLPKYLVHTPFICEHTWIPPCYKIEEDIIIKNDRKEGKDKGLGKVATKAVKKKSSDNECSDIYQLFTSQFISDKNVADSVEALIGAYLLSSGHHGALNFMSWLGLNPYGLLDENNQVEVVKSWPPVPRSPIIIEATDNCDILQKNGKFALLRGFENFEMRIGYKFNEPAYLLQAFTHPSYFYNEITDCYQRLEFIGDAVLDYLITRKLYDDPKEHSPGKLTDLRSALVNNAYFALLAVKYGYHKNFKCLSVNLCRLLENYISKLEGSEAFEIFEASGCYLQEVECFDLEEVDVPKALGDIFESVAGAIYLDSGMSLDAVWKVCYPMMKPAIDHLSEHVPKSPVRELLEKINDQKIFSVIESDEEKTIVRVTLPSGEEFYGIGPNKRVAKRSASKRALNFLKYRTQ